MRTVISLACVAVIATVAATPKSGAAQGTSQSARTAAAPTQAPGYTGLTFRTSMTMVGDKPQVGYSSIAQIDSGSPAQQAGLHVGDVILSVNGIDGRAPHALRFESGKRYVIRVKHDKEERELSLTPSPTGRP